MKAWMVGTDDEGFYLVHANTRGKAKYIALTKTDLSLWNDEWIYIKAKRAKKLDDLPFTLENAQRVLWFREPVDEDGIPYEGEEGTTADYVNLCPCEICKGAK